MPACQGLRQEAEHAAPRFHSRLHRCLRSVLGFHDIEKRIPIERLIAPQVTKVVD
jgi:hypothetical protein